MTSYVDVRDTLETVGEAHTQRHQTQAQRACTRSTHSSSAKSALEEEASSGRISSTKTTVALKHLTPTVAY